MIFLWICCAEISLLLLCGGCQLEKTVTGLKETVKSENVVAAALGGEVILHCNFTLAMDVLQVTWQKRNGSLFENIATYSPNWGPRLIGSFQKKAWFSSTALKASAITIQNVTLEDESYYRCIFSVFPHGSFSRDICLNVQTISGLVVEYEHHLISEGLLTAVCSATGKPPPEVTWMGDEQLLEPSEVHHVQNANGTVTVVSRHTFHTHHLQAVACLLDHPQGRVMKTIYPEKESEGIPKSVIIMAVVTTLSFTSSILCIMKLINRRKKLQNCRATSTTVEGEGLHQDPGKQDRSLHIQEDQHIAQLQ